MTKTPPTVLESIGSGDFERRRLVFRELFSAFIRCKRDVDDSVTNGQDRFDEEVLSGAADILRAIVFLLADTDVSGMRKLRAVANRLVREKRGAVGWAGQRLAELELRPAGTPEGVDHRGMTAETLAKVLGDSSYLFAASVSKSGGNADLLEFMELLVRSYRAAAGDAVVAPRLTAERIAIAEILCSVVATTASPLRTWMVDHGAFPELRSTYAHICVANAIGRADVAHRRDEGTVEGAIEAMGYPRELARKLFEYRSARAKRKSK